MIRVGCTVPSACARCTVTGSLNRLLCKPSTRAGPGRDAKEAPIGADRRCDRKHLDRPETRPLPPADRLWRHGELELRPSLEKRLQRAPALHTRKLVPQAEVDPGAE